MKKNLTLPQLIMIGSLLFGMFFGAGNLIFPIHLGQTESSNYFFASIGFLITGVGLPFLGVISIGYSRSKGLFDLTSKIDKKFAFIFTMALYLTIGPLVGIPRSITVPFETGVSSLFNIDKTLFLFFFSLIFILIVRYFSLRSSNIMVWIGKILNPLFLICLSILFAIIFIKPIGQIQTNFNFSLNHFFNGFIVGYNTLDAIASLAFGIIVIESIKSLGIKDPKYIAKNTFKAGIITVILMSIIYFLLTYVGNMSILKFAVSENGGIALYEISNYYFGAFGVLFLSTIVTLACIKTAIGLVSACSSTFNEIFPKIKYNTFVNGLCLVSFLISNVGLTMIIQLAVPILMLLYPISIVLIFLALIIPPNEKNTILYKSSILFAFIGSLPSFLKSLPKPLQTNDFINYILNFSNSLPLSSTNMEWILPTIIGVLIGIILLKKNNAVQIIE